MKQAFREKLHLSKQNIEQLKIINEIIEEYALEGYKMTLRQLYYQLVSRDIIPNVTKEYAKLSGLLVKGRMGGVVDWDAIEDRIRIPDLPYYVNDVDGAISDTISQYRLDRQDGQEVYIELWVEKDALSGVLQRITYEYHINLMVNRGYSSCTALHDAYERFVDYKLEDKKIVILYLGDHDPSGLDMVRDINDRLTEFFGEEDVVDVIHIGLTQEQIKKYNPPENPLKRKKSKLSDPRGEAYFKEFGDTSWEVDALNPKVLHELVRKNVEKLIDRGLFDEKLTQEEKDKKELTIFAEERKRT